MHPVATYGIHENSIIALIGGNDKPLPKAPTSSSAGPRKSKSLVPSTEESTIATIRAELASVQDAIEPSLDKFLNAISTEPDASGAPPSSELPEPADGRAKATGDILFIFRACR